MVATIKTIFLTTGHVIPDDGYAQEEAVFYNDQRVADPIQSKIS